MTLYIYCRIIHKVQTRMEALYGLSQNSSFPVTEGGENLGKLSSYVVLDTNA
jgi:hypothetical protein